MLPIDKVKHQALIKKAIADHVDDKLIIFTGIEKNIVSKTIFLMFSPVVRTLIASLPCCTTSSIIIPNFSSSVVQHLANILEAGFTTGVSIDSFKQVYEIVDLAKHLNIDISDLRRDVKTEAPQDEKKENVEETEEINAAELNAPDNSFSENTDALTKEDIFLLQNKQKMISKDILSFISLFRSGVQQLKCSECSELVTRSNVVEHCKGHIMEINKKIDELSGGKLVNESEEQGSNEVIARSIECENKPPVDDLYNLELIKAEIPEDEINKEPYNCEICISQFKTKELLLKHYTIIHCLSELEKLLDVFCEETKCKLCDHNFQEKFSLQMHLGVKHMKTNEILVERGIQPVMIKDVEEKLEDFNSSRIQNSTAPESKVTCQICDKTKNSLMSLWKHYIMEHSILRKQLAKQFNIDSSNLKCPECDHKMKSKLTRIIHVGIVHKRLNDVLHEKGFKRLPIPKKYLGFNDAGERIDFDKYAQNPKLKAHECQLCQYKAKFKHHLEVHYLSHFGKELKSMCEKVTKNLKCEICDYSSKTRKDITLHVGSKHGYINKILIRKGYDIIRKKKKNTRMVRQEAKHNVETPEVTIENNKTNILDGILDILSLTSKEEAPKLGDKEERKLKKSSNDLSCDQCNKSFKQRANLNTHNKNIHLGLKPFKCKYCDKEFSQKSNMKVHEQRRHSAKCLSSFD